MVLIHYTLASHRDDAIMVLITVPGERWEVERFISNGEICGEEALHELWTTYADAQQ